MANGMYEIISKKRDGLELGREEIAFVIRGYVKGEIPDYQVAAWLMAIYIRGLNERELADLTEIMLASGDRIPLDSVPGKKIDKHSTGGVGDKISFVVAPLLAACGVRVPMLSGRGLGHTGGTLDKLEAIPGMNVFLDPGQIPRGPGLNRHGHLRPDREHRAGRQEDLRPARRHGHGQLHPADRFLDHEQEAGPGLRRHRAGRQDRQRRLHEGRAGLHPPVPHHGGHRRQRPGARPWASSPAWTSPWAGPWATAWR